MPKESKDQPLYSFPADHIIALISEQYPEREDLIPVIRVCNNGQWESPAYVHFVNSSRPNEEGSEWQFDENIILESEDEGTIVLDILKDGRIGGVEFVSRIGSHF
ncbi:MAG TPA: hypothetical protein VF974_04215 [Patescibacteria group bacterium]